VTLNQPPSFTSPLQDHTVALGSTLTYLLPPFLDPDSKKEEELSITTTAAFRPHLPPFITFASPEYTFTPTQQAHLGSHQILVTLSDSRQAKQTYMFLVNVINATIDVSQGGYQSITSNRTTTSVKEAGKTEAKEDYLANSTKIKEARLYASIK
jgi:hypothetical protein